MKFDLLSFAAGQMMSGARAPVIVEALPETGRPGIIYLVANGGDPPNLYDEYIWVSAEIGYELLGKREIDLSGYATTSAMTEALAGKVDKIAGKGLSTEDYATADKNKLAGIEAGANKTLIDDALGVAGNAADAKATGDALAALEAQNALLRELVSGIDADIYRTVTGNPATFADGKAANLKALSVSLTPLHSGSGDPSPSNVRPISGVSSVTVTRTGTDGANSQSVAVALVNGADPLTVYGGTLDVMTGVLTVSYRTRQLNGSETAYGSSAWFSVPVKDGTRQSVSYITDIDANKGRDANLVVQAGIVCDCYKSVSYADMNENGAHGVAAFRDNTTGYLFFNDSRFPAASDLSAFRAWLAENPVTVAYRITNPATYQLTPAQLASLAGYNSVSADSGTLSVTYLSDPAIALGGG